MEGIPKQNLEKCVHKLIDAVEDEQGCVESLLVRRVQVWTNALHGLDDNGDAEDGKGVGNEEDDDASPEQGAGRVRESPDEQPRLAEHRHLPEDSNHPRQADCAENADVAEGDSVGLYAHYEGDERDDPYDKHSSEDHQQGVQEVRTTLGGGRQINSPSVGGQAQQHLRREERHEHVIGHEEEGVDSWAQCARGLLMRLNAHGDTIEGR